jgi:tetratricopeptide (TPR) repeat protein
MKRSAWTLGLSLTLLLALLAPAPWSAQDADPAADKREAQEKAREARIQEYLRKKEERRARREAEEKTKEEEAAAKRTAKEMAREQAAAERAAKEMAREEAVAAERTAKEMAREEAAKPAPNVADTVEATPNADAEEPKAKRVKKKRERETDRTREVRGGLPRGLAKTHQGLRDSDFGQDPSVVKYLDLIESGEASAQQIAAFGNFLGQAGRPRTALEYYDLALSLDDEDTTIWLNAGTLQRQIGNLGAAAAAYAQALGINPNHANAHYNLGAVLDEMGEYDASIEEYRLALTIDPTLGDPAINPQAANNDKLTAVRMMLYKEQAGNLGLPLVTVPNGEVDDKE